jgi:hypothetical protein
MLGRVLAGELGRRLPASTVYFESGAISVSPDATVELNIERLDKDAAGQLVLTAQVAVVFNGRREPITRSLRFTATPPTDTTSGQVAATSAVVGQLADALAGLLAGGAT